MPRIEIGAVNDSPSTAGRPLMSDHNLSSRLWATGAVLAVPIASVTGVGWWLPLHIALLGAITQAIVGGQLMFSATLGLARGPSRSTTIAQLALLNAGALLVIAGRLWGWKPTFATGAALVTVTIAWVIWTVHRLWRVSANRRFAITGVFYRLAGLSLFLGASIGGALGIGAFNEGASYLAHRNAHMILNVFGWAGLTIVGTAITLLPTILHVRALNLSVVRPAPWLMAGGLLVLATGATTGQEVVAGLGMALYLAGLASFALYLRAVLIIPRRRKIPTAGFHLVAAMAWAITTTAVAVISMIQGNSAATRDFVVVGGAVGFAFQALLGAWSFLLPSTRPPVPEQRRVELVAMELGGKAQVALYNVGLVIALVGMRNSSDVALIGIVMSWIAATTALAKCWAFPLLAKLPTVKRRSSTWWADPASTSETS